MDLTDADQRRRWHTHLAGLFAGRKVICGIAPLAAMNDLVAVLAGAGAETPLLVHTQRGAGPVPSPAQAAAVEVPLGGYPTMTEELRDHDRVLRSLPGAVREAVDAYDPAREAIWCVGPFIDAAPVDGRQVVGGRPSAWAALEDKLLADDLWDAVGFPRSERRVVEVAAPDALDDVSRALDLGSGVVWAGDARDGFNGGGEFTRWVTTAAEREAALDFFKPRCTRVRVMPFLEGVPCSIHGIVLPDGTAVFRPVELAILRGADRRFVYGGQGTYWDPPGADREQMRDLVRRIGELLRERVGYRGGLGIDGVLTNEGFRPTELNPRFSGGLVTLARGVDLALFQMLQLNLAAGRDPGVTVADLEAWALPVLDAHRVVQPRAVCDRRIVEEPLDLAVTWDGERLHRDRDGRLRLMVAPSPMGTFAKVEAGDVLRVGDRVGPLNAALMRYLDDELGAGFGPVSAAPDVRT